MVQRYSNASFVYQGYIHYEMLNYKFIVAREYFL